MLFLRATAALGRNAPMSAEAQIRTFLAKYEPAVAKRARALRKALRQQVGGAVELVYENYNALVFAYSPSERPGDAVLSLAVYPRYVTLFFAHGKELKDPAGVLRGSGARVRSVRLDALELEAPVVQALVAQVVGRFPKGTVRTEVRAVAKVQRARKK